MVTITKNAIKRQTKRAMEHSWNLRMMIVDYMRQENLNWDTEENRLYMMAQMAHDLQDMINDIIPWENE